MGCGGISSLEARELYLPRQIWVSHLWPILPVRCSGVPLAVLPSFSTWDCPLPAQSVVGGIPLRLSGNILGVECVSWNGINLILAWYFYYESARKCRDTSAFSYWCTGTTNLCTCFKDILLSGYRRTNALVDRCGQLQMPCQWIVK